MAEQFKQIMRDERIRVEFGDENLVMEDGLQPYLLSTNNGALIVQAQLPLLPYNTKKMVYHVQLATVISRDGGKSWERFIRQPDQDDVNIEGGAAQLRDGSIIALDTFVLSSDQDGLGVGELWMAQDDWTNMHTPVEAVFHMPDIDYDASTGDMGESHRAGRLHRSLVELPNGDLLTTMYCGFKGDLIPCPYLPATMFKERTVLFRSQDKGRTWYFVSSVTKDTDYGTEGFVEPVLVYVSQGKHEGRLICIIRTGRELVQCFSDDGGVTWSDQRPLQFGEIDIYRTEDWKEQFSKPSAFDTGEPANMTSLFGMYADPELIEMHNGVLVCAFGVRLPEKACWFDPTHPWNGNFLAFSLDQGDTWSHCIQIDHLGNSNDALHGRAGAEPQ